MSYEKWLLSFVIAVSSLYCTRIFSQPFRTFSCLKTQTTDTDSSYQDVVEKRQQPAFWIVWSKQTPTQRRQDRINLVWYSFVSSSTSGYTDQSRLWHCRCLWFVTMGVYIDANVSMRTHVAKSIAVCFAALRQIWNVLQSLPPSAIWTLVVSRLYWQHDLAGIPACLLRSLQFVLNAAARIIVGLLGSVHISMTLATFIGVVRPNASSLN